MNYQTIVSGIVIGFSIAAPVGPIGVLCIRRTLADGRLRGLVSGLGAATADAVYGCLAAFGLTFLSEFLIQQQTWLFLLGGLFLCILGIRTAMAKPSDKPPNEKKFRIASDYGSTFLLTLTNPVTILSFVAIFIELGAGSSVTDYVSAALLVLSVFAGSALWWVTLSGGVSLLRAKLNRDVLKWINRVSGGIIFAFGVYAFLTLVA